MQIECTTISAAAQVLSLLLNAGMRPSYDYRIGPTLSMAPPFIITLLTTVPPEHLVQLRTIADCTLIE